VADEAAISDPELWAAIAELKRGIPVADHGALESRAQALINDPDMDNDDVVGVLRREFGATDSGVARGRGSRN